jgi:hypothetical protein
MSYMSSLEIKGRNAYAVNVLNKLRHKLLGREITFDDKDAKIILSSLELTENPKLSPNLIKYSLYGLSTYEESSALELSEIIKNTSDNITDKDLKSPDYIKHLRHYLESKEYSQDIKKTQKEEISAILKLINSAIDNIYSRTLTKSDFNNQDAKGI